MQSHLREQVSEITYIFTENRGPHSSVIFLNTALVLSKANFKCECWFTTYIRDNKFRFLILNTHTFLQSSLIAHYKMSSA